MTPRIRKAHGMWVVVAGHCTFYGRSIEQAWQVYERFR